MVGGGGAGDAFYLKFWVSRPHWSKIADFQPIFARSAWAVTPSEKSSINTNRKSTMRFLVSWRWSSYVAPKPPKGGSKTQNARISSKIALCLKKICYKVSLCEYCQRQSCKAFIGLTNREKMIGGGWHLLPEILDQSDRVGAKSSIFALFSFVAPQPLHLCANCQGQTCKAFIGLTIRAKMIGGRRPLVPEILSQSDRVGAKFEQ